jgi:hypothetical protein
MLLVKRTFDNVTLDKTAIVVVTLDTKCKIIVDKMT